MNPRLRNGKERVQKQKHNIKNYVCKNTGGFRTTIYLVVLELG